MSVLLKLHFCFIISRASRIVDPALGCVFNDESAENLQKLLEFRAIVLCNSSAAQFKV